MVNNREIINDVLVSLFNEIWELEEKAIITEEYKDITNNDMHIIEAVTRRGKYVCHCNPAGDYGGVSYHIHEQSGKKGYVRRERSERDRRVVYIYLTEKGRSAYAHHAKFHQDMTDAAFGLLREDEIPLLVRTLQDLSAFFEATGSDHTPFFLTDICETAFVAVRLCACSAYIPAVICQGGDRSRCLLPAEPASIVPFPFFFGSLMLSTSPIRFTRRIQWVSVTMAGFPNTSPMIRLALFLPTPGRARSASKSSGTFPLYFSWRIFIQALISRPCSCRVRRASQ